MHLIIIFMSIYITPEFCACINIEYKLNKNAYNLLDRFLKVGIFGKKKAINRFDFGGSRLTAG